MEKVHTNKDSLNTGSSQASSGSLSNVLDNAHIYKSILKKSGSSISTTPPIVSTAVRQGEVNEGFKASDLAAKLKNIDGKIVGRDGRVLKTVRGVKFADQVDGLSMDQNVVNVAGNVEALGNVKSTNNVAAQDSCGARHENELNETQVSNANQQASATLPKQSNANGMTSSDVGSKTAPILSYASMFKTKNTFKSVNICELRNEECVEGAHVTIPMKEIEDVSARFVNTLYGYFIGKRLAFPIVENYVKNTWAKFGLERVMLNNGFFLFQFSTKEGMEQVLETGPWLIRSIPIFLNLWTPNTTLAKEEITSAPVWLKLHNVPIVAYTEVGLSLITTQIGKPIMLDSYTSSMCVKSWGQNSYARALVEVSSLNTLMDHVVVAIPFSNGSGHSLVRIEIEYEWKPPCCTVCKIFDHHDAACPKNAKQSNVLPNVDEEGFVTATKRKGKGKAKTHEKVIDGVRFTKPKVQFNYRWQPVVKPKGGSDGASTSKGNGTSNEPNVPKELGDKSTSSLETNGMNSLDKQPTSAAGQNTLDKQPTSDVRVHSKYIHDDLSDIVNKNPFSVLGDGVILGVEEGASQPDKGVQQVDSESDTEVDEYLEFGKLSTDTSNLKEASTSSLDVPHV